MTAKEQIENNAKTIREMKASISALGQSAREVGRAYSDLAKVAKGWQLKSVPAEQIEQYKVEILDCAEKAGFDQNDLIDKLTDDFLRNHFCNHSAPEAVLTFCLV